MTTVQAIILAIIEGITEFLPISSTGHMIIGSAVMGINENAFVKTFEVNIQFGAILSVVVLYFKRFFQSFEFYLKLFVAFLPAAVIGLLLSDYIDMLLESVWVVAIMLVIGGIILVFVDSWFPNADKIEEKSISYPTALLIGFFQCLAMIPGTSRSASSIVGGMTQKLSRKQAAEFSFFLAVPTMFAAAGYKLLKSIKEGEFALQGNDLPNLLIGNFVAFLVAMLAIRFFINFLTKNGFKAFGYYRIIVGGIILILLGMGYDLKII